MAEDQLPHQRLSRRTFLRLSAAAALGNLIEAPTQRADAAVPAPVTLDPLQASVADLARAVRDKRVSATELVHACLRRIDAVNPWLNAVVQLSAEAALAEAGAADTALARGNVSGRLHGVPMTIKDSLDTAGVVTSWGTMLRADHVPDEDATVVARLRAEGAILLGKTNTPELTLSFETTNALYGTTNNPYDIDRSPGGSSGGAAAIVAAGGAPFDVGSDTGGSVRLPSHCCGIAGLRPTSGRVPRTGHAVRPGGLLDSLTQIGPMARYVRDLDLLLAIMAGPDRRDPGIVPMPLGEAAGVRLNGMRATLHTDNGIATPTAATRQVVQAAADALARAGVLFDERRPPGIEQSLALYLELFNWDGGAWRRMLLARAAPAQERAQTERATRPSHSAAQVVDLIDRWDRFRARMHAFLAPYDLLICPVSAAPALPHGQARSHLETFSYTMTYSLTGWPAACVRAGTSPEGLPIGVQIVARPWREHIALAAAAEIERALGGWQPAPL